jgi:hypothetical protein
VEERFQDTYGKDSLTAKIPGSEGWRKILFFPSDSPYTSQANCPNRSVMEIDVLVADLHFIGFVQSFFLLFENNLV